MSPKSAKGGLKAYAESAGLTVIPSPELPGLTPLLCKGDSRVTLSGARGQLEGGVEADLGHYTYVDEDDDGPDKRYDFTVVLASVPESIGFIPRLICRPEGVSGGSTFTSGLADHEDSMRRDRGVDLESEELEGRYDLRVDADVGDNWVRQLFSPAFITWLTHDAPERIGFELNDGALCVYMPERLTGAQPLDRLWRAAGHIVGRLRGEALEEEGRHEAGTAAQPDRPEESLAAEVERNMLRVDWPEPPPDAATAIKAYRWIGMQSLRAWLYGIGILIGGWLLSAFLLWGGEGDGLIGLLATPFAAGMIFWKIAGDRAKAFGKAAFARGYAESRGLRQENPRLFQARHMRLKLPGVVESAITGHLTALDREGTVLLISSTSGKTRTDYDAVAVELPEGFELSPNEDGLRTVQHDRTGVLYLTSAGATKRTAAELDELLEKAGAVVLRVRRPAGRAR